MRGSSVEEVQCYYAGHYVIILASLSRSFLPPRVRRALSFELSSDFSPCFSSSLPSIVRVRRDATFRDAASHPDPVPPSLCLSVSFSLSLSCLFPLVSYSLYRCLLLGLGSLFPSCDFTITVSSDTVSRGLLAVCSLRGKGISSEWYLVSFAHDRSSRFCFTLLSGR